MEKRFVLMKDMQVSQSSIYQCNPQACILVIVCDLDLRFVDDLL